MQGPWFQNNEQYLIQKIFPTDAQNKTLLFDKRNLNIELQKI